MIVIKRDGRKVDFDKDKIKEAVLKAFNEVYGKLIDYGTWDEMYSIYWSRVKNGIRNFINAREGFKDFICNDDEIMQSKGVFIITENEELMKQIDIVKKKATVPDFYGL